MKNSQLLDRRQQTGRVLGGIFLLVFLLVAGWRLPAVAQTAPPACDPAPSGLVSWWPAQGNANGIIGGNNGSLLNGASFGPGEVGEAFFFGTTNAGVRVSASPSLDVGLDNGLTVEGWINPSTLASRGYIVEWNNGDTNESAPYGVQLQILGPGELGLGAGNLFADVHDTNGATHWIMAPGGTVATNVFQHVALTYDQASGLATLYCNGAVVAQESLGSFTPLTSYDFYIGRRPAGIGSVGSFAGSIDEMSLYNRALSSNEIAAIYLAGSNGKCPPNPPEIISQPTNQMVATGQRASFSVTATGTGLNYQWQFHAANIAGATNANYYLAGATTNNSGNYDVVVSDSGGSVTSSNAVLTVIPPPRAATATAILTSDFVTGITNFDGGSGYTNTPLIRLIGGGGSGAGAFAVVSNGTIISITVTNAGFGYTHAPQVVIDPPFIFNPVLGIAPMSFLAFADLTIGGTYQLQLFSGWYWTNQPASFTATNSAYAQMVAGVNGNYRLALNPVPTQAFATPQVVDGFVVAATVTSGGSGYVTAPAVSIVGRSDIAASGFSSISSGEVTRITITNAGYAYTNIPIIQIAPPPAAAVSPIVYPVMRVDSVNLAPYDNYQIEFKPVIGGSWSNWDAGEFTPTAATNSQFIFIPNGPGFFRVQHVP